MSNAKHSPGLAGKCLVEAGHGPSTHGASRAANGLPLIRQIAQQQRRVRDVEYHLAQDAGSHVL
ncbi:hypothetical protein, partial [Paraburkholderia sp. BCC1876]|uniref:hypothetical protein n=1 Tax=Paraburkholderia sp. BCC1876 TaxID=2676303 RepID=UPI001ABA8B2D